MEEMHGTSVGDAPTRPYKQSGFTIVELLIVIVVIGILAALVITTYTGIQAKARNGQRQSDLKSLRTHIEAYFSQEGHYPSLADMNDSSWVGTNLPSLDKNALVDPSNTSQSSQLASSPTAHQYSYQPSDDSNASCEGADTNCSKYILTATYEGSGTLALNNLD
jgi:prepilin-type N-terminal cleavage/methylation domain-containing protein